MIVLGSASIAQVHAATLKTKERVVLKIQQPKIYEWMERDVALLRKAVKILNLSNIVSSVVNLDMVIDEFWYTANKKWILRLKHSLRNDLRMNIKIVNLLMHLNL